MSEVALSLPEPDWAGRKFDLYSSTLPFLSKVYSAKPFTPSSPHFPELYAKILKFQAKPDSSGWFRLPSNSSDGSLHIPSIAEPSGGEPLTVTINPTVPYGEVEFSTKESISADKTFAGLVNHGFEGLADVEDGSGFGITGFGILKLRKVWEEDRKKLYEGFFAVECVYGPMLKGKGHGSGEKYQGTFWAVEALDQDSDFEDEDEEE